MDINADVSVEELLEQHPEAAGFLAERGIVCIRCGEPYWGSLRELAATRNLATRIEDIVAELREFLKMSRS